MILSALWAPQIESFGSLFKYLQKVLSYAVPPVVAMFLVGIFWKRANARGAFISLVGGVFLGLVLFITNEFLGLTDIHFLYIAPVLFVASVILLIGGSLTTAPPDEERVAPYMWTPKFYHAETEELRQYPWYQNYRILSLGLLVVTIAVVISFW